MGFGLSFGAKKQSSKTKSDITKLETTNQQQSGTQTTTGNTTQNTTGNTTGQSTTQQAGTSNQVGTQTGTTQQKTQQFSDETLGGLEGEVSRLFGASPHGPVGNFDPEAFVSGGLASARATQEDQLDTSIGALYDSVGGSASTNSAVALLTNKLRGDAAANLAGIEGNLNAQANEIQRSNVLAGNTIDATQQGFLTSLLGALKGGVASTTGTEQQNTTNAGTTSQTGATQTAEQTSQQQQQTQALVQALNQILTGTVNTVGHEDSKTKGKSAGGGLSLSI